MTTARKSFIFSLVFHALMGSLAFVALTQMRIPPPMVKIPLRHMMLLSQSDSARAPIKQKNSAQKAGTTPLVPSTPLISQPQPVPTHPAPYASPSAVPTVSASPTIQHTIQNAPSVESIQTPPKPRIDLAAEKRAFLASLRSTIQSHLRYPSAARRRGMEGEVGVRFNLEGDGTINAISVQRGEEIFYNSAKIAVASASGINIPKNLTDALPMEIELVLEFKLNG